MLSIFTLLRIVRKMRSTFVALAFCILISHHFVNAKELRFECNVLQGDDCWFEVYSYGYKVEHFDLYTESLISFHNYQLYQSSYITFAKFQVQISSQPGRQESSGEIHLHAERTNKQLSLSREVQKTTTKQQLL